MAKDNATILESTTTKGETSQTVFIADLLSEGPIEGLVDGEASVFLNNTRIMAKEDATYNSKFNNYTISFSGSTGTVTGMTTGPTLPSIGEKYIRLLKTVTISGVTITKASTGGVTGIVMYDLTKGAETFSSIQSIGDNTKRCRILNDDGTAVSASAIIGDVSGDKFLLATSATSDIDFSGTFTVVLDQAYPITNISYGANATITVTGTPPSGNFAFQIGTEDLVEGAVFSSQQTPGKYEKTTVQFRNGELYQKPLDEIGGVGNVSIAGSVSNLELKQIAATSYPTDGYFDGDSANGTEQSINASSGFGLSAAQIKEVDELRFNINYGSLISNSQNTGNPGKTSALYRVRLDVVYNGQTTTYDIYGGDKPPLVHTNKTQSPVSYGHTISLEGLGPRDDFTLKIARLTRHSGTGVKENGQNKASRYKQNSISAVSTVSSVIKEKFIYPLTAYAGVTFSSKEFTSVPQRTYHCRGMKVEIPSNYTTREASTNGIADYDGVWNGAFKAEKEYTDNPAWIFYDILRNDRYGVGQWINVDEIDKYALYRVSRYCDELVDDGKGGLEPRFRANLYLTKATDVYKVIKDMATIFMGMLYWMDGQISPVIDQPNDAVFNFAKNNVIGGTFNYETTGSKTRINQVVVSWNNPEANYELQPLIVEDRDAIVEAGRIISQDAVAFGATSEGQATRFGRWKLWTAQNQTEIVSFQSALNVGFLKPGDVINVQDSDRYPNSSLSGRVVAQTSGATPLSTTLIPLDRNVTLSAGYTYQISCLITDSTCILTQDEATISSTTYYKGDELTFAQGYTKAQASTILDDSGDLVAVAYNEHSHVETRSVSNSSGTHASLTASSAFSVIPQVNSPWVLTETEVTSSRKTAGAKKEYRILSIAESSKNIYDIVAVEHYNQKYDAVDKDYLLGYIDDVVFPPKNIDDAVPPPENVYVLMHSDFQKKGEEITLRWDAPKDPGTSDPYRFTAGYEILHNIDGIDSPIKVSKDTRSHSFVKVEDGEHTFGVRTITTDKDRSKYATTTVNIDDPFSADVPRLAYGVPQGVYATSDVSIDQDTDTLQFDDKIYALAALQDSSVRYTSTFATSSSWSIDVSNLVKQTYEGAQLTPLVNFLQSYYVLFDYSEAVASNDPFKVMKWDFLSLVDLYFWRDINAPSDFVNLTGTVNIPANSNKVTGSGTSFTTELEVGHIIKLSTENQNYFGSGVGDYGAKGAKVAAIVSDTELYIDRSFNEAVTSYQPKVPSFQVDFDTDGIIAKVWEPYNGGAAADIEITSFVTIKPSLVKVFRLPRAQEPTASKYNLKIGDLWYVTDENNELYIWSDTNADGIGDQWVKTAQVFQEQVMQCFFCPNTPTAGSYPSATTVVNNGDYWWDSNEPTEANSWYVRVNDTWTQIEYNALGRALGGGYWYDNAALSPPQEFAIFWWTAQPTDADRPDGEDLKDYDIWYQNANADVSAWYWDNTAGSWVSFEAKGKLATKDTVSSPDIDPDIELSDTFILNNTASPELADLKFEAGASYGGGTAHYISSVIAGSDYVDSVEDGNIQSLLITMYDQNKTHLDRKGASIADSDLTISGGAITAIAATTPNTTPYDKPDQVVVTIIDPVGTGAEFTPVIDGSGYITSYTQVSGGSGYSSTPGEEPIVIVGQKIPTSRTLGWTNDWTDDNSLIYFPTSTSLRIDGELYSGIHKRPMFATDAYLDEIYHIVGDSLTSTDGTEEYFGTNPLIIPHNSGKGQKSWAYQLKNDGYIDPTSTIDAAAGRHLVDYAAGPTVGRVIACTVSSGGTGYSDSFAVTFTGGGGSGAAGTAYASGGVVQRVEITNWGSGYTSGNPTPVFTAGGGSGATGTTIRNSGIGESDFSTISARKIILALGTNDAGAYRLSSTYYQTIVEGLINDIVTSGGKQLALILPYYTQGANLTNLVAYRNATIAAAASEGLKQLWDVPLSGHTRGEWELGVGTHIGLEGHNMLRREIYNRMVVWGAGNPGDLAVDGIITWGGGKYGLGAFGNTGIIYNTAASSGAENVITWAIDGALNLWHDNSIKLTTTVNGIQIPAGAEATPGLVFDNDADSGFWSSAAGAINISSNGSEVLEIGAFGATFGVTLNAPGSSAAVPAYSFTGDLDTGIFSDTAGAVQISSNTTEVFEISTLGLTTTVAVNVPGGTNSLPGYAFNGDLDTGIFSDTAGAVQVSSNGTEVIEASTFGITTSVAINIPGGTNSLPGYAFNGDLDTGIFSDTAGAVQISSNGTEVFEISTFGLTTTVGVNVPGGSPAGNMAYSFTGDLNTGITSDTAGTIQFVSDASEKAEINSGGLVVTGAIGVSDVTGYTAGDSLLAYNSFNKIVDSGFSVDITTPSNGQVLTYNSTSGDWENQDAASSGYTDGDTIKAATGTAAAPGLTFNADAANGIYLTVGPPDGINITTDGVNRATFSSLGLNINAIACSGNITCADPTTDDHVGDRGYNDARYAELTGGVDAAFTGPIRADYGSATAPGYAFDGDTNTGIWRSTADALDITTGGVNRATFSALGLNINAIACSGNITCADPTTDDHVGDRGYNDARYEADLGNPASDGYILSSTVAGTRSWIAPVTGGYTDGDTIKAAYGTSTAPGLTFNGDTNTGLYRISDGAIGITCNSTQHASISNLGFWASNMSCTGQIVGKTGASASSPSFTFSGDSNTGMYQSSANSLAFAVDGTWYCSLGNNALTGDGIQILQIATSSFAYPTMQIEGGTGPGYYLADDDTAGRTHWWNMQMNASSGNIEWKKNSSTKLRFTSTGSRVDWYDGSNVRGYVDINSNSFRIGTPATTGDDLHFITGGTERFRYDNGANAFLIARTTQATSGSKLEVNGTAYFGAVVADGSNQTGPGTIGATSLTSGDVYANAFGVLYTSSDQRLKKNVANLNLGLSELLQLRPVSFDWIDNSDIACGTGSDIGLIAQEVNEVVPALCSLNENTGYYTVTYSKLTLLLINAIKELKSEIDELKGVNK